MAIGSPGVVGASGTAGQFDFNSDVQNAQENNPQNTATQRRSNRPPGGTSGQGAQFVFVAATVEHITEDGGLLGIATPDDSQFYHHLCVCYFNGGKSNRCIRILEDQKRLHSQHKPDIIDSGMAGKSK